MWLDAGTVLTGILIFAARIVDVSLGTVRTISTVQGRTKVAFLLGFTEVSIWLFVIVAIVQRVQERPILGVFYALGFSTGNVVGILLERRLAFGHVVVRVFSSAKGEEIASALRKAGYSATTFPGMGEEGPVQEICSVCRRRDVAGIRAVVSQIQPNAFHVVEIAGAVSRIVRPSMQTPTGWRAVLKKK